MNRLKLGFLLMSTCEPGRVPDTEDNVFGHFCSTLTVWAGGQLPMFDVVWISRPQWRMAIV